MSLATAFASIAGQVSAVAGVPFVDAIVMSLGQPEHDAGGDVIPNTGAPTRRPCRAQFTTCTEQMRRADGYTSKDMRILILAGTIDGEITTEDRINVASGKYAGIWQIQSAGSDSGGIGWDIRGRRG